MGALADSGMTAKKIAQCSRVVLGTPAYFRKAGKPKIPSDLKNHEAIVHTRGGGGNVWTFQRGSTEASVATSGRLKVNAAEGVRAAVLADMGITVASEWMFEQELKDGSVKQVLSEWTLPPMDLWAVYPTGRMASAKARAFVAFVEEIMAA